MRSLADLVTIKDRLLIQFGKKLGYYLLSNWEQPVDVKGYVTIYGEDDRGRIIPGTLREGNNICTETGREWYARLSVYKSYGASSATDVVERDDRLRYIGLGDGTQDAVAGVKSLASPIPYNAAGTEFLAEIDAPSSFPRTSPTSSSTSVRLKRRFEKTEVSINGVSKSFSEVGLFTDGNPGASPAFAPRTRVTTLAAAATQSPMFYKTSEAFPKVTRAAIVVIWDVRF